MISLQSARSISKRSILLLHYFVFLFMKMNLIPSFLCYKAVVNFHVPHASGSKDGAVTK